MCFSLIMVTAAAALDQREFPCHACQLKLWPDLTLSILREGHRNRLTSHQKRQQISFYGHAKDSTVTSWPSITMNRSKPDFLWGKSIRGVSQNIFFTAQTIENYAYMNF